jgi:hypothetical protein
MLNARAPTDKPIVAEKGKTVIDCEISHEGAFPYAKL